MEDDDDDRRLEAAVQALMRQLESHAHSSRHTLDVLRDSINAIPEVVSTAFSDAAFEQADRLGQECGAGLSRGLQPLAALLQSFDSVVHQFLEHQTRLARTLRRCIIACVLLLGLLIGINLMSMIAYADLSARAQALQNVWLQVLKASPPDRDATGR